MKTKVFRVSCFSGERLERTPQTPVKRTTIYFPDNVLGTTPSPKEKAEQWAIEVLRLRNDPQFKGRCHCDVESAEVDLSEYGTPNLESPQGSKAWIN
jgi:hypothetical protein